MRSFILLLVFVVGNFAAAQSLPEAPKPQKSEKLIIAFDYGATLLDAAVSSQMTTCQELNPIYGKYPSTQRYYFQMLGQTTAITFVNHLLIRRGRSRLARLGAITDISLHLFGVGQTVANHCL